MLKTLGIVEAAFCSPRFRANASRKLGGRWLLEWVVRRVTDSIRLDGVIVLASGAAEYHSLCDLVPADVPVFFSDKPDRLSRFAAAVDEFPCEGAVCVHGDNPFIDPGLIDRLVTTAQAHPQSDYITYCCRDGRPAILSPAGIFGEWFRVRALRRAARRATDPGDREHLTRYFCARPEEFRICLVPAPTRIDREDVRLTIDSDEDWDHILAIYEALGPDALDWQRIADLLDHHPALRHRMAAMNREGRA